jgi:hypothetical protein
MKYYPRHVYFADVDERALFSDGYFLAEWRCDPWSGFDLDEGVWRRVRYHNYEQIASVDWARQSLGEVARDDQYFGRDLIEMRRAGTAEPATSMPMTSFVGRRREGRELLFDDSTLTMFVKVIGGEPERWRSNVVSRAMLAYDGDHWLGTVMACFPRVPGGVAA